MEQNSPLWRSLARERHVSFLAKIQDIIASFSITEKTLFLICAALLIGAVLSLTAKVSYSFGSEVPSTGGELVEGVVGTPRFVNPLLAASDADRDLTTLVYSGLLKATSEGTYIPDLAEKYTISPDGLIYTFTIRKDAKFHDGVAVTADDVKFTVEKAQDSALKSPRRVNWEGVTVEKTDANTIVFSLKQPYAPFIGSLTSGILPKHVWQNLESDQIPFSDKNLNAIGSGPYKIDSIKRSKDGIPTEFTLRANSNYALGEPYISKISLKFYSNESNLVNALENGDVESASNLTPNSARIVENRTNLLSAPLTRVFGVFFNQNENEILAHKEVRKALSLSINKENIIESVLLGYGSQADGPLPPTVSNTIIGTSTASSSKAQALDVLTAAKWKKNPATGLVELKGKTSSSTISITLSTANIPELVESAKKIEEDWKSLGVTVDVQVFEPADLNQGVIRPRKYEALLFGIVTGKNADLYPFWHSSQRNDPGLNISMYTNTTADKVLERMRIATSTEAIATQYTLLKKEIDTDAPAAFLWSPDFIYAVPTKLQGVKLGEITTPSDRFIGVSEWYVKTDHVWNIFLDDEDEIINK